MTAKQIVEQMMKNDAFSRWLGIEVLIANPGLCKLSLEIRPEMLNGFSVAHGGIAYALADSALAFAANGHGEQAMSISCSMSYVKPISSGDNITATATEKHRGKTLGRYGIEITNNQGKTVAFFEGTVMFLGKKWNLTE
ncbi:MAG: hotdog fold thioesterase [Cryomorphaceae bacterium]|nr:hotdog fold thioesterase [Cryomorphaceae bacterium]